METQRVMLSLLPLTKWPLPFSTGPRTLSMGAPSQSATGCHQNRAASEGKVQPCPQADLVFKYLLLGELWCSGSHQPPHLPRPSGAPLGWPAGTSAFAREVLSAPRHDLAAFLMPLVPSPLAGLLRSLSFLCQFQSSRKSWRLYPQHLDSIPW